MANSLPMDLSFEKEPVAIVGSACRFAGDATSPSRLWDLLKNPIDLRQEIPTSRYDPDGFYHPDGSFHGHSNVRHAHFLDQDPAAFDAAFFGIKPVEAKAMDPQQRLLLEVVYEGLESAGIPISKMKGSDTGVYVGVMFNDYAAMMLRDVQDLPTYYATGTGQSILSNRISHFFDLHGPSVTIDTACSSSLVAVHLAVQALRSGESRLALACGANLILGPEGFIIESKLNMLSPDGRSRMWSQGANGYARGEGVGVLVLKTLRAALEDGDEIECIIRETGLGQDGATPGITMPSAAAQETLIRNTYTRAGLDLLNPGDRPQYFEAHGTGTPAGDPAEAEAIYRAFFTSTDGGQLPNPLSLGRGHPLYVGSIKTVLGHTEGAAGVAALIKTSLVLQQGLIPPNLLFDELSDRVAPFYKNVEILRDPRPWPTTYGGPRRASVNSFGFGGTNAHAILESHDSKADHLPSSVATTFTPFVLSATSELALRETMSNYATWLDTIQGNLDFNPQDLAWTLRKRRSVFQYRTSFTASSFAELRDKILAKLKDKEIPGIGTRAVSSSISSEEPCGRILGIFTGQGAQYPRMGADLIENSSTARGIIKRLESYLAQLPEDRPSWSLEAELLADPSVSRLQGAALAQPLCTALQILLVDLLKLAGLQFSAVVGHSSGEIGAAYAAGYLSARDAMLIAYYRGLHASRTADLSGAMLAVGGSMDDMADLCADEAFVGRVAVAAHNSLSSVTISGDEDAIEELELVLEDEGKFYRRLKVDKAYHSHHMMPCFDPYVDSMRRVGIKPLERSGPDQQCPWFSSVYDGRVVDGNLGWGLNGPYWAENMTKPVLFSEALGNALHASSYDLVLEVGPHPALKAPSAQTMKDSLGVDLPYHGLLARGMSAVDALSSALGFMWEHLDRPGVDLDKFERAMTGAEGHRYRLVKGLPAYPWSRERRYWHEARSSRKMRLRHDTVHPLLGDITTDSAPHHASWRNLLRVTEMEWLAGHAVQGQIVFPAAGYLASAIEAAWLVATKSGKEVRLIEISDFAIHQAVAFEHDDASIEVLIELSEVIRRSPGLIRAKFTYSAATDPSSVDLSLAASGDVTIHLGEPSPSLLPTRPPVLPHMIDVERERFYAALADLGYNFEGRFRALSSLRRKRGKSTCVVNMQPSSLLIHPAELDAMMQSAILAYSYPYDGELRTLHLPTTITRIRVNPAALRGGATERVGPGEQALVDASIDLRRGQGIGGSIVANINLYAPPSAACRTEAVHAVQAQGVAYVPLRGSTEEEDRRMYSKVDWIHDRPDGIEASRGLWEGEHQRKTAHLLERIATFYLRKFDREVPLDHPARTTFPTKWYLNHARHVAGVVESGKHKWWGDEWHNDTEESVLEASKHHMHLPDVEIMHLVGRQMPRVFAGETTMLEEFRAGGNDVLDRYYAEGLGLRELARWVARAVKQLTDRYPHMNIVEVGAGTGGATKAIFGEIGDSFLSYTYTDISAAFFENASAVFSKHGSKMVLKTLDIERDPTEQGFASGTYDLVVAFFVIHATSDLECSLRNLRKLLKPGGFLVVGEGSETGTGAATSGFIFGTLPGWWVGTDKGRVLSPLVSPREWDSLLRKTGFSGADAAPPISVEDIFNVFPVVSQAVDAHINSLRAPLDPEIGLERAGTSLIKKLIIVGGATACSSRIVQGLQSILGKKFAAKSYHFKYLTDIDFGTADGGSVLVSLTELDSPVFRDITPERFNALKTVLEPGNTVLWVTSGRLCDEPFANMTVAFGRVATHETPDLRLQHLDIHDPEQVSVDVIAEMVLRLHAQGSGEESNNILWTFEPEIVIDKDGHQLVPRLNFIDELNDRYNAARRLVVREVDVQSTIAPIALEVAQDGSYMLKEISRYEAEPLVGGDESQSLIELRTTHSILSALKTPFGHRFLAVGMPIGEQIPYLALVSSPASVIRIPRDSAVACAVPGLSNEDVLRLVAAHLIPMAVLERFYSGQTLIAHNVPRIVANALALQATAKGINTVYLTDLADDDLPGSWIKLPRFLTQSEMEDILVTADPPAGFAGFTNHDVEKSENEDAILSNLDSRWHTIETAASLYSRVASCNSSITSSRYSSSLQGILRTALSFIASRQQVTIGGHLPLDPVTESVCLGSLTSGSQPVDPLCVVDWTDRTPLPVCVSRLDTGRMFRADSAYWIVGMSGALGISLADWMISKGVRHLVMTSRKPEIAPEWIASHQRKGAKVTVIPCDVTNEAALKDVYQTIQNSIPPIAGVIHGAMVLRDTSISNMTFDQLTEVIRPKVDGSIYLDRIFWNVDLDFFVLTSSINTVIGNLGQANYAAANAFMCSLAAQRRKRGLRAAAVNGGAIIGAGYMEREARRAWDRIAQNNYMMRLSEEDFVQSICEAIDASRLDSWHGPEISTGLGHVPADAANPPFWSGDPKFSNFITYQQGASGKGAESNAGLAMAAASIQDLVRDCQSEREVQDVVEHAFANTLRAILHVSTSDEGLMASRSNEIGLDSLVSVNIRSWFLKHLQVGIPVLRIMGNGTMRSLVQLAIEGMPPELTPQLHATSPAEHDADAGSKSPSFGSDRHTSSSVTIPDTGSIADDGEAGKTGSDSSLSTTVIDWEAESCPPGELLDIPLATDLPPPSMPPRIILLTGATGLLGRHLLSHLLNRTGTEKVICLAIRNLSSRLANGELPAPGPRIEYHEGDLPAPLLGLPPDLADAIFSSADAVIHNGAETSHMKDYSSLRATNVGSTTALIRACLPRRIPLHYVSSAGLAILYGKEAFPPVSVTGPGCARPATDGSFGYAAAKWTCERILERVHEAYGGAWKVCVHRPSTIIREGSDAEERKAGLDWVNAMLAYAKKSRTVPQLNRNRGALDLVKVQTACEELVRRVVNGDERMDRGEVGYVHQVGDVVIPLDKLEKIGLDEGGKPFKALPMSEWIANAVEDGLHPAVAALVEMLDDEGASHYPRLLRTIPE